MFANCYHKTTRKGPTPSCLSCVQEVQQRSQQRFRINVGSTLAADPSTYPVQTTAAGA